MSDTLKDIENKLLTVSDGREKADLLNELSWELRQSDPQRGIAVAAQADRLSRELSYSRGLATSLCHRGVNHFFLSEFDQAIGELVQALKIFNEIEDKKGQALTLNWMGNGCHRLGDYPKALQYHLDSMALRKALNLTI